MTRRSKLIGLRFKVNIGDGLVWPETAATRTRSIKLDAGGSGIERQFCNKYLKSITDLYMDSGVDVLVQDPAFGCETGQEFVAHLAACCTIRFMTNRSMFKSGMSRQQPSLVPARIEDYVDRSNPVRAVDAYGDAVDLQKAGFRHPGSGGGRGQPPYDPRDLLKLYVYGYLHGIRSSRRLEREAGRNLELIWLLKGLEPGYRTIANFRKDNWAALKAVCRDFVLMMRELGLVGGERVAIDGAFFDGNASKASITTQKKLAERLAALDRDIEAYGAALEANDLAEAERPAADRDGDGRGDADGEDVAQKVAALMQQRAEGASRPRAA